MHEWEKLMQTDFYEKSDKFKIRRKMNFTLAEKFSFEEEMFNIWSVQQRLKL